MKAKKGTLPVIMGVSPLTCNVMDEAGNGIVGFTAIYTDGTFKNITLPFCPDTYAAVNSEIITMKQIMERSLGSLTAAIPQNSDNHTTNNSKKRRLS